MSRKPSLLHNSAFRRLWAVQFSSMAVVYGVSLAGVVVIEDLTHSSTQTGLAIVSSILPAFLASLISGAVVDRFGRLRVLIASLALRVLIALAFWVATQLGAPWAVLAAVYAVNVVGIATTQFAASAEASLLPDLVDRERLMSANALFQVSLLAAQGLGIVALAPMVIKVAGPPAMGLVGAAFYLVALVLAASLRRQPAGCAPQARTWPGWTAFASDLQAGWRVIARDRMLGVVTLQVTVAGVLLLVLLSLVPGLISRHLDLTVEDAPFLLLPGGIGFLVGLFVVGRRQRRLNRPAWIAAGLICLGGAIGLLAVVSRQGSPASVWLSIPPIVAMGLTLAMVIIPARTMLQDRPPAEVRGRVISAQLALANAAAVLPLLVGGSLADWFGIRPVIGLLGVLAVSTGALGLHQARS